MLARHLVFGLAGRTLLERETVTVAGRAGIRVLLDGLQDGVPVRVEAFVLKGEGCVYDLVYVAAPADFEVGRGAFRKFVESFAGS